MTTVDDEVAKARARLDAEAATLRPVEGLSDLGNARRLVQRHGAELLHCRAHRTWYVWDGSRFRKDETGEVMRRAKETARSIWEEAARAPDADARKHLGTHAGRSEAEPRLRAMVTVAETEPEIAVAPNELDANPDLLNVLNGTIDLRTITLKPHDPGDMITKLAPVEFEPGASSMFWDYFLRRQIPDQELRAYLARVVGYMLQGRPIEDVVPFIHGPGASGKTTFSEAVRRMLGDYARAADFRSFLRGRSRDGAGHTEDLARLEGARLVVAAEVQEGASLDEGTLKKLTGGEAYVARGLNSASREIVPQFTVMLVSNDRPKVRDDDDATWRRLNVVPFEQARPQGKRYGSLRSRLLDPVKCGPGILGWALDGLADYRDGGLRPPAAVKDASASYRDAMNPLKRGWLEECCEIDPDQSADFASLWKSYSHWQEDQRLKPWEQLSKQEFAAKLSALGFEPVPSARVATRIGLRLKDSRLLGA